MGHFRVRSQIRFIKKYFEQKQAHQSWPLEFNRLFCTVKHNVEHTASFQARFLAAIKNPTIGSPSNSLPFDLTSSCQIRYFNSFTIC